MKPIKNGSHLVLFRDKDKSKETFLVFRSDFNIWDIPGGGIENNETPREASLREAKEETRFSVKIESEVGIYELPEKKYKGYMFVGRVISGKYKPEFPECRGKWFPVNKLPLTIPYGVREAVSDCMKNSSYFRKRGTNILSIKNLHLFILRPFSALKYIKRNLE